MPMSERKKFEVWATGHGLLMMRELKRTSWTKAIKTDRYANEYSQGAWDGWQASRRAALEEAASIVDGAETPDGWSNSHIAEAIRALAKAD